MARFWRICAPGLTVAACTPGLVACGGNAFSSGTSSDAGTGVSDSGAAPEAEASMPPVDAGTSFCAGRPEMFCEDFDEYPTINALLGSSTWPSSEQAQGNFGFDTTTPLSAPNSLQVRGNDKAQVIIVKTFPAITFTPKTVRLTFDLRVNDPGMVGAFSAAGFAAIAFGSTLDNGYVAMAIGSGPQLAAIWSLGAGTAPTDAGTFQISNATGSFPSTGVWDGTYSVQIDYTNAAGPCLQVYRGGVNPLLPQCMVLPAQLVHGKVISIGLGDETGGFGTTGAIGLEFDNVLFDVK